MAADKTGSEERRCSMMKGLVPVLVLGVGTSVAIAGNVNFYGGDPDGRGGWLSCQLGIYDFQLLDDMDWNGDTLTSVFGHYFADDPSDIIGVQVEIRAGVSNGNGGTLIHTETTTDFSVTDTGNNYNTWDILRLDVDLTDYALAAGSYHVSIQPIASDISFWYLMLTDGFEGVGSPLLNENSFFDSVYFGADYLDMDVVLGSGRWDWSWGACTSVIPLPTAGAMGLAGLGIVGGIRRRRMA
jgi:hypothetical protein